MNATKPAIIRCSLLIVVLMTFVLPVNAEVFKCKTRSGKTVYQSQACDASSRQQHVLKVEEMTPEQREAAQNKLQLWQQQRADEEAARAQEAHQRQLERERQETLALQRRSVLAQEQQARAAALRQLPVYTGGYGYGPYFPYSPWQHYSQSPFPGHDHDDHYHRFNNPAPPPVSPAPRLMPVPAPGMMPPPAAVRAAPPALKATR